MIDSFRALLIDADVQARVRLKETLKNITYKNDIRAVRSLREAEPSLRGLGEAYDGVFIASDFDRKAILDLIEIAQHNQAGRKAFYVLVLKGSQRESSYVADLFLSGVDGFVAEPYVAEKLTSTIETLMRDRKRKFEEEEKKRAVLGFLVGDMLGLIAQRIKELDRDANARGGYTLKKMRETSAQIMNLAEGIRDVYEHVLIDKLENLPPPKEGARPKRKKKKKEKVAHPGEAMQRMIEERGLNMDVVRAHLGLDAAEFEKLVTGQKEVDDELAGKLAHALGGTKGFWIHLQNMCSSRGQYEKG